jgi:hypothetical protein
MVSRRWTALVVALVTVSLSPSMGSAATVDQPARIIGADGLEYPSAPLVIVGTNGDLYLGLEYDYACAWGGTMFEKGMQRLAATARLIEQSGRRVVFTIAPAKADIVRENLPQSALPQGSCDTSGLDAQRKLLNSFPDANYVSARKPVAADPRQTYWKDDMHWNEVGASDWTLALADDLDPRLARRQRYRDVTESHYGFLNHLLGDPTVETGPTVEYAGGVQSRTAKGSPSPLGSLGSDISWRSTPARQTWPGRTLLLGDSYTVVGLDSLAPLFRRGRFLWNNDNNEEVIADAVAASDTVVIEVYQSFLCGSPLGSVTMRKALKKRLR